MSKKISLCIAMLVMCYALKATAADNPFPIVRYFPVSTEVNDITMKTFGTFYSLLTNLPRANDTETFLIDFNENYSSANPLVPDCWPFQVSWVATGSRPDASINPVVNPDFLICTATGNGPQNPETSPYYTFVQQKMIICTVRCPADASSYEPLPRLMKIVFTGTVDILGATIPFPPQVIDFRINGQPLQFMGTTPDGRSQYYAMFFITPGTSQDLILQRPVRSHWAATLGGVVYNMWPGLRGTFSISSKL